MQSYNTKQIHESRTLMKRVAGANKALVLSLAVFTVFGAYVFRSVDRSMSLQKSSAAAYNTLSSPYCSSQATPDVRTPNRLYNVKTYGAVGNGSGDDTAAIQAAVNAANTAGGGTVWFPEGKYVVTTVTIYPNITYKGTNATLWRPANQGKYMRTFTTGSAQVFQTDSSPLIVRCLVFDGNKDQQGAYRSHELEQAHLVYAQAAPTSPGKINLVVEDSAFINGVADGVSIHTNANATVNRVYMNDVFRGGVVATGGNSRMDVFNYWFEGTPGHDSMDFEVDQPGYQNNTKIEINLYNFDGAYTLDVDLGYSVEEHKNDWWGGIPGSDPNSILRAKNLKIRSGNNGFIISTMKGKMCFQKSELHVPQRSGGAGFVILSKDVEFKDSLLVYESTPIWQSVGDTAIFHRWHEYQTYDDGAHMIRFDNVDFVRDPAATVGFPMSVVYSQNQQPGDTIAIVNSRIAPSLSNPVVKTPTGTGSYSTTAQTQCDWSFPTYPDEMDKIPLLNGHAPYATSTPFGPGSNPPTPTPSYTPTPTVPVSPTPTPTAAAATYDDASSHFTFTPESTTPGGESSAWVKYGPGLAGAETNYQSGNHTTKLVGAKSTVTFNGTGFKLYGSTGYNYGIATISVDGGAATNIDAYRTGGSQASQQLFYTSPTLKPGNHSAVITVTGTKNAASADTYFVLDKLEVVGENTPVTTPTPTASALIRISVPTTYTRINSKPYDLAARSVALTVSVTGSAPGLNATVNGVTTPISSGKLILPNANGDYKVIIKDASRTYFSQTVRIRHPDYNRDNTVNITDLNLLAARIGKPYRAAYTIYDLNLDGKLDATDTARLQAGWGK